MAGVTKIEIKETAEELHHLRILCKLDVLQLSSSKEDRLAL